MSKKKKQQQAQLELERQRNTQSAPRASFRVMNNSNPVPVARPADFIQLTPIVQPMSIVPFSSQKQPLAMFEDDE